MLLGALGIYGIIRFFTPRNADDKDVNWTPLEAIGVTIAIFFITQLTVGLAAALIGQAQGLSEDQTNQILESSPGWQFLVVFSIEAATAALVCWFVRKRRTSLRAIGVVKPKLRDIGYALAGFGAYFGIYALVVYNLLQQYLPQIDTNQQQELGFNTNITGPELGFVFLSLAILPPLVEELLVRGFLFTGLRTRLPVIWAAITASVVFASAHLQWGSGAPLLWTAAADTFVLSLVLIWLRQKTGSLWPGIGVHFIKNSLAFVALFIFKVT